MGIQNIKRAVPAPHMLAVKSSKFYLELIKKLVPAWGPALEKKNITIPHAWVCLWAAAVAVGNACRISEVLRVKGCNILANGHAVVTGSKGSSARMIDTGLQAQVADTFRTKHPTRCLFEVQYREVWRQVIYCGLAVQEPAHTNRTVTHQGRYRLVQEMQGAVGLKAAGEAIGHKSARSTAYYANTPEAQRDRKCQKLKNTPSRKQSLVDEMLEAFNEVQNAQD